MKHKIIPNSLTLAVCMVLASCQFAGFPKTQQHGTVVNESKLPQSVLWTPHMGEQPWSSEVEQFIIQFGRYSRIEAGSKNVNLGDGAIVTYRCVSQDMNGESSWAFIWSHPKYGSGQKLVTYKGSTVYAINKKDFKLGLMPPPTSESGPRD